MASLGFCMLFMNALSYIFNWNMQSPAFRVSGLVFVAVG